MRASQSPSARDHMRDCVCSSSPSVSARATAPARVLTPSLRYRARVCERTIVMRSGRIVEQGESRALFDNPQTAYTRELVEAVPHLERGQAVLA